MRFLTCISLLTGLALSAAGSTVFLSGSGTSESASTLDSADRPFAAAEELDPLVATEFSNPTVMSDQSDSANDPNLQFTGFLGGITVVDTFMGRGSCVITPKNTLCDSGSARSWLGVLDKSAF